MNQLNYNIEQSEAFAGMKGDSRFDTVESHLAEGAIPFGYGVMSGVEDAVRQVRLPSTINSVLSASVPLVASNSTVVTINGTALDAVVYATSHAATMAVIAAAIQALDDVLTCTVDTNDLIIVGEDGTAIVASAVTTAGSGQPTWTAVATDPGVFRGISIHRHVEKALVTGVAQYADKDAVDVLRKGVVWMPIETTAASVSVDDTAYINLAVLAERGKVTEVSSGNIATGGIIKKLATSAGGEAMALVEINLP